MVMRERKAAVCKQGHVGKCCMELNEKYTGDLKCGKCGNDFLINCLSCGCHIKGEPYSDNTWLSLPLHIPSNNYHNCVKIIGTVEKPNLKFFKYYPYCSKRAFHCQCRYIITLMDPTF